MTIRGASARSWRVVLPVKTLHTAKSRLAPAVGPLRGELALAMALDTIEAALACPEVGAVVVVTDDEGVRAALAATPAYVVPDQPAAGINAALRYGAAYRAEAAAGPGVVGLSADLPALRPGELSAALRSAGRHRRSFVVDAGGTGTTMYAAASIGDFEPQFGPDSGRIHRTDAVALELDAPSLRRDVDTLDDLWAAIRLGVGARTASLQRLLPARSA